LVSRTRRYNKIRYSAEAIDRLLGDLFIKSHTTAPDEVALDLDATQS
jgi:hypothetical protein